MKGHALFPVPEGEEADFEVSWIQITRFGVQGPETAPRLFSAEELNGTEDIYQQFGGGTYELTARAGGPSGRQFITKKHKFSLAGASKPLEGAPTSPPASFVAPAVAAAGPAGGNDSILLAVLQMMQQSSQFMTQMMLKSTEMTMSMMTAMMTNVKGDQTAMVDAISKMSAADKANMAQFFQAMAATKGGGGGGEIATFMKGVDFAGQLAGADEEEAPVNIGETIKAVAEGVKAVASMQPSPRANGGPS